MNTDRELNRDLKFALAMHMVLVGVLFYLLVFVATDLVTDTLGSIPQPLEQVSEIGFAIRDNLYWFVPIFVAGFWADGFIFTRLAKRRGIRSAWWWTLSVVLCLAVASFACFWSFNATGEVDRLLEGLRSLQ